MQGLLTGQFCAGNIYEAQRLTRNTSNNMGAAPLVNFCQHPGLVPQQTNMAGGVSSLVVLSLVVLSHVVLVLSNCMLVRGQTCSLSGTM